MSAIVAAARDRLPTAQEVVLESLRQAILEGVLPPGTRLRQEDLAAIVGSRSRLPVREALRALEYEGLVDSTPNRGFTVTGLDPEDIEEIYDIRITLEAHAVRLAIPLLTDEDMDDLTRLYEEMEHSVDPDSQLGAREQFYLRLYSVTTRPRLVGMISRLRQEVARSLRWRPRAALAGAPPAVLRSSQTARCGARRRGADSPLSQGLGATASLPPGSRADPGTGWQPALGAGRISTRRRSAVPRPGRGARQARASGAPGPSAPTDCHRGRSPRRVRPGCVHPRPGWRARR